MKAREYTSRQPHHTKYKIKEIQGENLFRLKLELICNLYSGIIKGQKFFLKLNSKAVKETYIYKT